MRERIDLVNANARRLGWESTGSSGGDGGMMLSFHKGPFEADVAVRSELSDYFCNVRHLRGTRDCVDNLQVTRRG
jgi:hypothetical protein